MSNPEFCINLTIIKIRESLLLAKQKFSCISRHHPRGTAVSNARSSRCSPCRRVSWGAENRFPLALRFKFRIFKHDIVLLETRRSKVNFREYRFNLPDYCNAIFFRITVLRPFNRLEPYKIVRPQTNRGQVATKVPSPQDIAPIKRSHLANLRKMNLVI